MNNLFSVQKKSGHIILRILGIKFSFKVRAKLAAVMCVKNESYHLPTFLKHIEKYVDFIVAVDDGSTDNTLEILKSHPKCKIVHRLPYHDSKDWTEAANRELVLKSAFECGADWVLCCDPDERFELNFLKNIRKLIKNSKNSTCFHLHVRECWGNYKFYRSDGIWAKKEKGVLFPVYENMIFDSDFNPHIPWFHREISNHELIDFNIYHLKMIKNIHREERKNLYKELDPNCEMQKIGYDYLTDCNGIQLELIYDSIKYDYKQLPDDLKKYSELSEDI